MAQNTKIEWATHTFNPWIGCTKIGPGCDHCYAQVLMDTRHGRAKWGAGEPRARTSEANWKLPLKWDRAAGRAAMADTDGSHQRPRVFCSSLADVFDNEVDPEWRADLFELIRTTPHLDWLLLTKRIGNVLKMAGPSASLPENVWLGATVVNQLEFDRDAAKLRDLKSAGVAQRTFLSMEPLLGPVDLHHHILFQPCPNWLDEDGCPPGMDPETGMTECCQRCDFTGIGYDLGIDWIIVGGESGHGARPMDPDWARSLRDQCAGAGVPFLFKQWGEWAAAPEIVEASGQSFHKFDDGAWMQRVGKKTAGRLLDGVHHDGVPA